jgi:hypothetical protein
MNDLPFVVEEYDQETGKKIRNLAAADNAIIAGADFKKACEYLPNANIVYRHKARVIGKQ